MSGAVLARFATATAPTVYIMVAADVDELRAMLPPGLIRSERQPGDPEGVIEVGSVRHSHNSLSCGVRNKETCDLIPRTCG